MPDIPVTGLFGAGWDDVSWNNTAVLDAVIAFNDLSGDDTAVVSNGIDFFEAVESAGVVPNLPVLRGGWGNDWDMWPASLAERTSRVRRALERLRAAEALAVFAQLHDPDYWPPVRQRIENGLMSVWKYFEHGWNVTTGGPTLAQMQLDKETWTADIEHAVDEAIAAAEATLATRFTTPDEDRIAVFNPLGFARTDVVDLEGIAGRRVVDVATGSEVPAQEISTTGGSALRFIARDVPALGYRVYRLEPGAPGTGSASVVIDTESQAIESSRHRVRLGSRGQIVEALWKGDDDPVEIAGANGLNDFGTGTIESVTAENVGPVSATLRIDLTTPERSVRVTLFPEVDRIAIDNTIEQNVSGTTTYSFDVAVADADIRFEEIGAIARPGLTQEGGDFLQGTRASRMTLNHFVSFSDDDLSVTLSNQDAFAMQVNDSTDASFDLTGSEVHVIATDRPPGAGTTDQGGDRRFVNRFAILVARGPGDDAAAMRFSLAHQNPLHPVALARTSHGPFTEPVESLVSVNADNVVTTAFKPAEDPGAGYVLRMWELGDRSTGLEIDASRMGVRRAFRTSLIETDVSQAECTDGTIAGELEANEIATYRLVTHLDSPLVLRPEGRRP